jgi:hypothetical protein
VPETYSPYYDVEIDGVDDNEHWDYILTAIPRTGDHIVLRHPDENPRIFEVRHVTWHPNAANVTGRPGVRLDVKPYDKDRP